MTASARLSRRGLGLVAASLAALVGLSACSSGQSPVTGGQDAGGKRTITDALGKQVEVPANPQRVLALSEQDLDAVLAMDVKPVGTVNGRGQKTPPRYLGDRLKDIKVVGDLSTPSMDKVVESTPDVILAGGVTDENVLNQLRQVAPTVVTFKLETDWKTAFRIEADALNKADKAKAVLADYDRKVQEVKGKLGPNANAEVSIVRWNPKGPGTMQTQQFASLVVADLGLRRPAAQQEPGFSHGSPLSLEALAKMDGDWLFLGTLTPDGEAVQAMEQARNMPAFQQLKAVRDNHLVAVDGSLWTSRGGPLGALAVVEDVSKAMAKS
ncbi:ABC transporter substrate-binding protein [Streptoalloteichus hindustanus]|uniref:Iron complex transport system substrate-binding protein n=1 Tax=Streptoalloteichus hindustanus TaxID=2017 RepID=A0A1M5JR70_STRHI|nr:ABC transporter substrate-binding protein [Streptoalloteichus hindustanus]SHG43018.1 iron complex transport system substrate-binding protein [Streptoalloteichus hindustanus]